MILKNFVKSKILVLILMALVAVFIFSAATSCLAEDTGVTKALEGLSKSGADLQNDKLQDFPATIGRFVGALLSFVGVLFLVLMIYGGFLWMTDRGNEDQVKKAKDLIQAAIIGLIIVLLAYAITKYIGDILFKG